MENYELRDYLISAIDELMEYCSEKEALKRISIPIQDYLELRRDFGKACIFRERIKSHQELYLPKLAEYENVEPRIPMFYSEEELTEKTNKTVRKLYKYWHEDWKKMTGKEKVNNFRKERCDFCDNYGSSKCKICPLNAGEPILRLGDYDFIEIGKVDCPCYEN